ncbi:MAG: PEGA domain-containing protein [Eubacteriales bacterium]|nr:PEGA domain-containing protein [Eubacteriales bacterium]
MRKLLVLIIPVVLAMLAVGCSGKSNIKVYDDTEETTVEHKTRTVAAVVTEIDLEHNIISLVECTSGVKTTLIYHGGVSVLNRYGDEVGIGAVALGSVFDVEYYEDTAKLVSLTQSASATTLNGVTKFSADVANGKATYKGASIQLSDSIVAFDGTKQMDVSEVNTEDQVTLNIFGDKLVSVVIELGHGYVRLSGQNTYIGGILEIGYDVIVPVTADMLLAVREGDYTLRVNKDGYCDSKEVRVVKDKETVVDLSDIAVPTGTVGFNITPEDATLTISGKEVGGFIYSNLYGSYSIRVEAEGYQTFRGSFKIDKPSKTITIDLVKLKDDEEDDTEEETTEQTTETGEATTDASTEASEEDTSEQTTEGTTETTEAISEGHTITFKEPAGAGVYLDGEYIGTAPVTIPKILGTHTVILYKSGYLIKSYTITTVDNGEDDEYSYPELTNLLDLIE